MDITTFTGLDFTDEHLALTFCEVLLLGSLTHGLLLLSNLVERSIPPAGHANEGVVRAESGHKRVVNSTLSGM